MMEGALSEGPAQRWKSAMQLRIRDALRSNENQYRHLDLHLETTPVRL